MARGLGDREVTTWAPNNCGDLEFEVEELAAWSDRDGITGPDDRLGVGEVENGRLVPLFLPSSAAAAFTTVRGAGDTILIATAGALVLTAWVASTLAASIVAITRRDV